MTTTLENIYESSLPWKTALSPQNIHYKSYLHYNDPHITSPLQLLIKQFSLPRVIIFIIIFVITGTNVIVRLRILRYTASQNTTDKASRHWVLLGIRYCTFDM